MERFDLRRKHTVFLEDNQIKELLHAKGVKVLPITMADGKVIKTGDYPAYEEICRALGIERLQQSRPMRLNIG